MDILRQSYPTDLTQAEWAQVQRAILAPRPGGRPAKHERGEIVDALLYATRTGCQWRALPRLLVGPDAPSGMTIEAIATTEGNGCSRSVSDRGSSGSRRSAATSPGPNRFAAVVDQPMPDRRRCMEEGRTDHRPGRKPSDPTESTDD